MRYNRLFFVLFLLAFSLVVHGQVEFNISIKEKEIGYFDPIELNVTMSYKGVDTSFYSIFGEKWRPISDSIRTLTNRPLLQYKHIDSLEWKTLLGSAYPRYEDISPLTFGTGSYKKISSKYSRVNKDLYYFPVSVDGDIVFRKKGTYLCRLWVYSFYTDTVGIVSSIDTIYVKKYKRRDRKVVKKLLKMENPRMVFSYLTHSSYGYMLNINSFSSLANEVLGWKSKSKYADLAKWHVINVMINRRFSMLEDRHSYRRLREMQLEVIEATEYPELHNKYRSLLTTDDADDYERLLKLQTKGTL